MLELFPFTNFHDLNLDWIIKIIKVYTKKVDDLYDFGLYDYVERVLAAHPEWTTTVMDDSITSNKINDEVSLTAAEIDSGFDIDYDINVQKTIFSGTDGDTTVYYSIIPAQYKPDLYLANDTVNTVQDAGENAADNGLVLSINAGLFDMSTDVSIGYVIENGSVKKGTNESTRGDFLFMTDDGELHAIGYTASLSDITVFDPVWCVKGWQAIYLNGSYVDFSDNINPMSFIGQDTDGNYIVGTTGGRGSDGVGFYSIDVYNFVMSTGFDLKFLYVLDGGGSVSLTCEGVRVNNMIQRERRKVANFIGWR